MSLFHTCGCVSVHGIVLTLFTLVILNTVFSVSKNTCVQLVLWKLALTVSMFYYMLCATAGTTGGEFI